MPTNPLGPTGLLAQSMTLPAGSQSMAMGGMGLRAQGMDGRKKGAGFQFSTSVAYVNSGNGAFSGSTFVFTATSTQEGDWMVIVADGVDATSVTGGSGVSWTKLTLTNVGAFVTTVFYRRLEAADAGASFTINGGITTGPAEWAAYRGVASVGSPQTQVTLASAPTIAFTAPTLTNRSSRLLAILSAHTNPPPSGTWSAPAIWSARVSWNAYGPKFLGDTSSSTYQQAGAGPITFTMPATQAAGQVGWLFELVGT
jgi:hypothetical protein